MALVTTPWAASTEAIWRSLDPSGMATVTAWPGAPGGLTWRATHQAAEASSDQHHHGHDGAQHRCGPAQQSRARAAGRRPARRPGRRGSGSLGRGCVGAGCRSGDGVLASAGGLRSRDRAGRAPAVEPGLEHDGGRRLVDDPAAGTAFHVLRSQVPVGGDRGEAFIVGVDRVGRWWHPAARPRPARPRPPARPTRRATGAGRRRCCSASHLRGQLAGCGGGRRPRRRERSITACRAWPGPRPGRSRPRRCGGSPGRGRGPARRFSRRVRPEAGPPPADRTWSSASSRRPASLPPAMASSAPLPAAAPDRAGRVGDQLGRVQPAVGGDRRRRWRPRRRRARRPAPRPGRPAGRARRRPGSRRSSRASPSTRADHHAVDAPDCASSPDARPGRLAPQLADLVAQLLVLGHPAARRRRPPRRRPRRAGRPPRPAGPRRGAGARSGRTR